MRGGRGGGAWLPYRAARVAPRARRSGAAARARAAWPLRRPDPGCSADACERSALLQYVAERTTCCKSSSSARALCANRFLRTRITGYAQRHARPRRRKFTFLACASSVLPLAPNSPQRGVHKRRKISASFYTDGPDAVERRDEEVTTGPGEGDDGRLAKRAHTAVRHCM